ncbi:MAG: hypothetical protein IJV64_12000 [Oscillospiraceae bacterium]|nr:hypothetical protein [Oscillospiraceae bacterium]
MEMEPNTTQTPMREIEIFGIPALFTERAIPDSEQYPGLHYYELISGEDNETLLGTVVTPIPVDITNESGRAVYDDDLDMGDEVIMLTPDEFEEKYLSPNYDSEDEGGDDGEDG